MCEDNKETNCCDTIGEKTNCLETMGVGICCCKVEAIIKVDDRGQMVLPKEIRERANIRAGDKLAMVTWEKDGKIWCMSLIPTGDFSDMVKERLGPMMDEMFKK